jgi:O-antigen/teichoic acid export membrane protein
MSPLQRNVFYNVVGQGLVLFLGFVAVKFIYGRLGEDIFGIIIFSQVLAVLLTNALELGISSTTIREVSAHLVSEPAYTRELIRTASLFYWGVGFVILVCIYLASPLLVQGWINLKTTDPQTAATMIRILAISAAVALPRVLYGSLFRGIERMGLNNVLDVALSAAQQLGIVLLLALGATNLAIASWIAVWATVGSLTYAIVAGRLFGWMSLLPGYSSTAIKRNLHFSGHMTAISALALIQTQTDKVIVSKLLPVADLGLYGFASATVGRATFVTSAITQAAFPSLSRLFKTGNVKELLSQYRKLHDLILYGTLPLFAGIVFAATPAYTYLFSASAAQRLFLPTALLCLGYLMNAALTMPYLVSISVGKPQFASRLNLVAIFVVLPVTIALIYWLGLVGAGLSWAFYNAFAIGYFIPRVSSALLDMRPSAWFGHFVRAILAGGLAYGVTWALIVVPGSHSISSLAVAYLAGSAAFLLVAYKFIGPELREAVHRLLERLVRSRAGRT